MHDFLLLLRREELQAAEDDHVKLQIFFLLLVEDLVFLEHNDATALEDGTNSFEAELGEEWVQAPQLVEWHLDCRDTRRSKT